MTECVVMFSGGATSWAAGKRAVAAYGRDHTRLLFSDTLIEDEDLYRFLPEAAANIGAPFVRIAEGRTPWQVFFAERFLANSLVDPCSRILKRQMLDRWLETNCDPADTVLVYGFDWSEGHRLKRMVDYGGPWQRTAPLLERPWLLKRQVVDLLRAEGIRPPRLYELGFQHNNCGGACVKAGQASWALLLRHFPDRYLFWEQKEQEFRETVSKNVAILTDRSGDGKKKPLTLRAFRERIQSGGQYDMFDHGACGCFMVADDAPQAALEGA